MLVHRLFEFQPVADTFSSSPDEREKFGKVEDYIEFLNTLYRADVLRVHARLPGATYDLWTFIAVNYGNRKIKVNGTSESRIQGLLTLWYFGWRFARFENKQIVISGSTTDRTISLSDILKFFSTKGSQAKWPTVNDQYRSLVDLFSNSSNAQVIKGSTTAPPEDECNKIGKQRLEQVFIEGLRHFARNISGADTDSLTI